MRPYTVIHAPSDLGLAPTGVAELGNALLSLGLFEGLTGPADVVRLQPPRFRWGRDRAAGVQNAAEIRQFTKELADEVGISIELGHFPIVLGGDCSILLGPLLALRRRGRFGLLFLDGHADFYSPEAEPNGDVASMELAIATGREPEILSNIDGLRPLIREEDVVAFGIRDTALATGHGSPQIGETAITVLELSDVRSLGAERATAVAVDALSSRGRDGFWIHLDADVLDDDVMPAVDYRMRGGLTAEELMRVLSTAFASPLACGLDVTIYNPALDDSDRSAGRTLASVIRASAGPPERP